MKSFKHLLLAKGVAAAIVGMSGIAAPAISHASPDDGVVCRVGYAATFANGNMKCSRQLPATRVQLACLKAGFPGDNGVPLIRVAAIPGDTTNGRDICLAPGRHLNSDDPIPASMKEGVDFVLAEINPAKAVAIRKAAQKGEEINLTLDVTGVDAHSSSTFIANAAGGADAVDVTVTLFTFPVPAPEFVLQPIQIDRPALDPLVGRIKPF